MMKQTIRIIQGLLIIVFLVFGMTKLTGNTMIVHEFTQVYGYSEAFMYIIGILEVLGALGLVVGYWKPSLATFASGGFVFILIGAIFTLWRAGQEISAIMPLAVLILTLIVFIGNRSLLEQKEIGKEE
ncbi:DoxX family protein [Priestia megaterium]|nr:DoxX family protein [Priestia megaterium]